MKKERQFPADGTKEALVTALQAVPRDNHQPGSPGGVGLPGELLEPARRFEANDYPCPRCGAQLPPFPGVHFCD